MNQSELVAKEPKQTGIHLDFRVIIASLLLVILAMLLIWKPWSTVTNKDRTIQVTGEATIKAAPDEFIFMPTYNFPNSDKSAALTALTAKNNELIAKLKGLGVTDTQIKTNADSWSYPIFTSSTDATPTYTLRVTLTIDKKDLAQKVQDYLVTTSPTGEITPQAEFSDSMRKKLGDRARDVASKDARAKADQSAKDLGFKVSSVKMVQDGGGFGGSIYPLDAKSVANSADNSSLRVQPGENDLNYTVTVTYYIK